MKAIYKGKIVEVDYLRKADDYATVDGRWVAKKDLTIIPESTEWTTYALVAVGAYLIGLITMMIL